MKRYKIKIKNTGIYVRAVVFGGNPFIQIIPAYFEGEIGIFEEDKAEKYVEELNRTHKSVTFELEEEKENGNKK